MAERGTIGFAEVLEVVELILNRAHERGYPLPGFIVLVGGSALAAHGVRAQSMDIDFYAEEVFDELVLEIETELKPRFGNAFRIDATTTPNLWGPVMIRDIAAAPDVGSIEIAGRKVRLQALSLEDLFLVKLAANRPKDRLDVTALAPLVELDRLYDRLSEFLKWHGNRGALPAYLDSFVRALRDEFGREPKDTISRLSVPDPMKAMLQESFYGPDSN